MAYKIIFILKQIIVFLCGMLFAFILMNILPSEVLASEIFYLTQNDINNFISAYNSFYGVDLPDFNLGNRGYFACGVYKNAITDRYNLFLYNGSSAKTVGDGSSKFSLQEVDGSKVFYLFDLKNGIWLPIGSKLNNTTSSVDGNSLFITDNIAVISTSNHVYFKYNLANSIIKNQVDDIVQQITVINNNYTVLNEQVSVLDTKVNDLQNENASVSEKIDTVIGNQQNTLDYLQKTPTNESTKSGIDSIFSSGEISKVFPEQEGKYGTQLENVVGSFTDALKNNKNTVNFSFAGKNYTVDINVLNNMYDGVPQLKALIQLITISFITWQIVKEVERITDAYNSFNFVEVTDSISNVHYTDIF